MCTNERERQQVRIGFAIAFERSAFFLPRPLAGEGWGEGRIY